MSSLLNVIRSFSTFSEYNYGIEILAFVDLTKFFEGRKVVLKCFMYICSFNFSLVFFTVFILCSHLYIIFLNPLDSNLFKNREQIRCKNRYKNKSEKNNSNNSQLHSIKPWTKSLVKWGFSSLDFVSSTEYIFGASCCIVHFLSVTLCLVLRLRCN